MMPARSLRSLLLAGAALTLAVAAQAAEPTTFTVTIKNVSTSETLKLPDGKSTNVPIAPGVYVVGARPSLLFAVGKPAGTALERLAEDGNFQPLLDQAKARKELSAAEMFVPGQAFTIAARPGDRLNFAAMFVQSNDLFFAPKAGGIALFDRNGKPVGGNLTSQIELYDAGTEVNQAPGVGANQAPRQAKPNTGASEHKPIAPVTARHDGFAYPSVASVIEIEITPVAGMPPQS